MKIEDGDMLTLDDNKEFICVKSASLDGKKYVFLMSNFKPLEIIFAEDVSNEFGPAVLEVEDQEIKEKLVELFK